MSQKQYLFLVQKFKEQSQGEKMTKKTFMEWNEIQEKTDNLHFQYNYDLIVTASRGGLIPSGMISYKLGIKDFVIVKISSYDDETDTQLDETKIDALSNFDTDKIKAAKNILIIDDIVDTGNTMGKLKEIVNQYKDGKPCIKSFSIVNKLDSEHFAAPDITLFDMIGDDSWIVFPWDK